MKTYARVLSRIFSELSSFCCQIPEWYWDHFLKFAFSSVVLHEYLKESLGHSVHSEASDTRQSTSGNGAAPQALEDFSKEQTWLFGLFCAHEERRINSHTQRQARVQSVRFPFSRSLLRECPPRR